MIDRNDSGVSTNCIEVGITGVSDRPVDGAMPMSPALDVDRRPGARPTQGDSDTSGYWTRENGNPRPRS